MKRTLSLITLLIIVSGCKNHYKTNKKEDDKIHQKLMGGIIVTDPISTSELHAGGIFFSIIYEESLKFELDSSVTLNRKVIDEFRPMDKADVDMIENTHLSGRLVTNSRGYLEIEFEDFRFIGAKVDSQVDMYSFNIWNKLSKSSYSRIYYMRTKNDQNDEI